MGDSGFLEGFADELEVELLVKGNDVSLGVNDNLGDAISFEVGDRCFHELAGDSLASPVGKNGETFDFGGLSGKTA